MKRRGGSPGPAFDPGVMRRFGFFAALTLAACGVKVNVHVSPSASEAPRECYERGTTVTWTQLAKPPSSAPSMLSLADPFRSNGTTNDFWLEGTDGQITLCRPEGTHGKAWRFEHAKGSWQLRWRRTW